jgi:choline dehydrogenase-like flavoprotein
MCHFQTLVLGLLPFSVHGHRGRSVTHVHDDFMVPDREALAAARQAGLPWMRGGMVEHGGSGMPIGRAKSMPWGPAHKDAMRSQVLAAKAWVFTMQGEDMPQPSNRVDLDPQVRDVRGFPAARVTYQPHRFELAASAHYVPTMEAVLKEMGAEHTFAVTSPDTASLGSYGDFISPVPNSKHVLGTARMGDDPATSVVDRWGRLHDVPNVMVADSSVFPTSSGYGPTLTLVALAMRNARALAG